MNRVFPLAVVTSLTIHSLLFLSGPGMSRERSRPTDAAQPLALASEPLLAQASQLPPLPLPSVIREAERPKPVASLPPTGAEGRVNIIERAKRPSLQPIVAEALVPQSRPNKPAVPAVIDLSNLAPDLGREPSYLQYFRSIRERIRYYAQRNLPSTSRGGEVFVRFILSAAGHLQAVEVDATRSVHDLALEHLSFESIKQAAPFPPFPLTFNQPQITFHIIIQYEAN